MTVWMIHDLLHPSRTSTKIYDSFKINMMLMHWLISFENLDIKPIMVLRSWFVAHDRNLQWNQSSYHWLIIVIFRLRSYNNLTIPMMVSIMIFYIQQKDLSNSEQPIDDQLQWPYFDSDHPTISIFVIQWFELQFAGNPLTIAFWVRSSNNLTISSMLGSMICFMQQNTSAKVSNLLMTAFDGDVVWLAFNLFCNCLISKSNYNFLGLDVTIYNTKTLLCEIWQFKQSVHSIRNYS